MASDEEGALIAPCGLYCGSCPLYVAAKDESVRQRVASRQGVSADKLVLCAGCRPLKGAIPAIRETTVCDTYACAVNDKKVEFCYECDDFPCLKLAPCTNRSQELPHNTKVYNLLQLKKLGVKAWLKKYPSLMAHYWQGKKPRPGSDIQL
jgi:hypothetical protein